MQYRRAYIPGSRYFFTLVTEQRRKLFIDDTKTYYAKLFGMS